MAVYQGKLMEDMIPEYIREKMHKAGIENPFFNKDVYDILCHDKETTLKDHKMEGEKFERFVYI